MLEKIMNLLTPGRRGENMTRDTVTSLLATCHRASEASMYLHLYVLIRFSDKSTLSTNYLQI